VIVMIRLSALFHGYENVILKMLDIREVSNWQRLLGKLVLKNSKRRLRIWSMPVGL
jgi:hypothetical protein